MTTPGAHEVDGRLGLLESLSGFSACYVAGGLGLVGILLGGTPSWLSLAAAFTTGWFVYMLHRVRVARREQQPLTSRARHLVQRRSTVQLLLWCSGTLAMATSFLVSPWLVLLLGASVGGMLLYGTGPDGRRLRDRLLIKNACVALALTLFWLLLLVVSDPTVLEHAASRHLVVLAVIFLVFADAMYCDLCDVEADMRTRSCTVPIHWGGSTARCLADMLIVLAAILILSSESLTGIPRLPVIAAVMVLFFFQIPLHCMRTAWIRNLVDGRLLLVATVSWILAELFSSTT